MTGEPRVLSRLELEAARALLRRARKAAAAGEHVKAGELRIKAARILSGRRTEPVVVPGPSRCA